MDKNISISKLLIELKKITNYKGVQEQRNGKVILDINNPDHIEWFNNDEDYDI